MPVKLVNPLWFSLSFCILYHKFARQQHNQCSQSASAIHSAGETWALQGQSEAVVGSKLKVKLSAKSSGDLSLSASKPVDVGGLFFFLGLLSASDYWRGQMQPASLLSGRAGRVGASMYAWPFRWNTGAWIFFSLSHKKMRREMKSLGLRVLHSALFSFRAPR